jgi:hypothetical protein
MTPNLPAVAFNDQASQAALAWFRLWLDFGDPADQTPWLRTSPMLPETSENFIRELLRRAALSHPTNRLQVIAMARAGDRASQAVLSAIIIEAQSSHTPLPPELIAYNMEVHAGMIRPYSPPGPRRKNKLLRDQYIAMAVEFLRDRFGGAVTFKEAKPKGRPSGRLPHCVTVAKAYTTVMEHRGGISPKRVEGIWRERRGSMPTVPGWSAEFFPGLPAS